MTEFEQQVADALIGLFDEEATHTERSTTPRQFITTDVALRVAAAIDAAAGAWRFHKPGGYHLTTRREALAVLRGAALKHACPDCGKTFARSTHQPCLAKLSPQPPGPPPYGNFAGMRPDEVYWDSMLRIWRAE